MRVLDRLSTNGWPALAIIAISGGCSSSTSADPQAGAPDSAVTSDASDAADGIGASTDTAVVYVAPVVPSPTNKYITFTLNTQEFVRVDASNATVNKVLDIHEKYGIPIDVFLADPVTRLYEKDYSALIARLKSSPVVSISYHVRPPLPYYGSFDWLGLSKMSEADMYTAILNYENHGVDLVTGQATTGDGGYEHIKSIFGYAPRMAGMQADAEVKSTIAKVLREKGVTFTIEHGASTPHLGDKNNNLFVRPEDVEIKFYEEAVKFTDAVKDTATLIDGAFAKADGKTPYFVNVKMHDNNFFSTKSAWTAVYVDGPRKPPFNLAGYGDSAKALSDAEMAVQWNGYEAVVAYARTKATAFTAINGVGLMTLVSK